MTQRKRSAQNELAPITFQSKQACASGSAKVVRSFSLTNTSNKKYDIILISFGFMLYALFFLTYVDLGQQLRNPDLIIQREPIEPNHSQLFADTEERLLISNEGRKMSSLTPIALAQSANLSADRNLTGSPATEPDRNDATSEDFVGDAEVRHIEPMLGRRHHWTIDHQRLWHRVFPRRRVIFSVGGSMMRDLELPEERLVPRRCA